MVTFCGELSVFNAVSTRQFLRNTSELVHVISITLSDVYRGGLVTAVTVQVKADSSLDDSILDAWMWVVQPSRGLGTTLVLWDTRGW
jgi:hypothetical protein